MVIELDSFLLTLAQVAGIFVGFGALIGFTKELDQDGSEYTLALNVVVSGLITLIGSLLPILLFIYEIDEALVWKWSTRIILFLSVVAIVYGTFLNDNLKITKDYFKEIGVLLTIVNVCILLSEHALLIAAVLNIELFENHLAEVYITVLGLFLIESSFQLSILVYSNSKKSM